MQLTPVRKKRMHRVLRTLCAAPLITAMAGSAHAQTTIIKLIVPYAAGGITDMAARVVADHMSKTLGRAVIVDNRPGASGQIGIQAVMRAAGDGNTLLFTNSSYSVLSVVNPSSHINPTTALAPVSLLATYSMQIVVPVQSPAHTLPEFIDYARKHAGKLSYGSSGVGSGTQFAGEYFKVLTHTDLAHVPYKSTSGAVNDVAAGLLDLAIDANAQPMIKAGHVKLLAVTGRTRDPRFPTTPTAAEAGLKPFVFQSWLGILAPASTPTPLLERLSAAARSAAADKDVAQRFADLGLQAQSGPPNLLADTIKNELALHRRIAKQASLRFN